MKKITTLFCVLAAALSTAQAPALQWSKQLTELSANTAHLA